MDFNETIKFLGAVNLAVYGKNPYTTIEKKLPVQHDTDTRVFKDDVLEITHEI